MWSSKSKLTHKYSGLHALLLYVSVSIALFVRLAVSGPGAPSMNWQSCVVKAVSFGLT